jgi:hypothetical protein
MQAGSSMDASALWTKNKRRLRRRGQRVRGTFQAAFLSTEEGIQLLYQGGEFLVIFLRNDLLTQGFEFSLFFESHRALSPNWGYLVHQQKILQAAIPD